MNKIVFTSVIERLIQNPTSQVPTIVLSIAVMLFLGFAMTRLTKLLRLPNVTAYILTGIILGPIFHVIPDSVISGTEFLADIALAFIAFSAGEFFRIDVLKKNMGKVIVITVFEALMASILVFVLTYFIIGLSSLPFCIILAALASATAPASTMMTVKQTGAKGDFVDTLLLVIALDDIIALLAYSIAIAVAKSSIASAGFDVWYIVKQLLISFGILALGGVFGLLLKVLMPKKRTNDNKLIIGIATLFAFCGICASLGQSPLLGCMSMGMVYINISKDDKFFKQLSYFSPPIFLLFFVRSGINCNFQSLVSGSSLGAMPLFVIGILYFVVRIIGKYSGGFLGCLIAKKPKTTRNYFGLALIPAAGVAIGLAAIGAREIGGEEGMALNTIILSSSILYELIGPACAKLSLYLSKSYSNNIDEIVSVEEVDSEGKKKSEVDILIDKIKKIQETIPKSEEMSEEEKAFNEAAYENYYNNYNNFSRNRKMHGR